MSSKIKVTCGSCREDVILSKEDIHMELSRMQDAGRYFFICPNCGFSNDKHADPRRVSVLLATGVKYEVKPTEEITEEEIEEFKHALKSDISIRRELGGT